ncbi:hypothetical protein GNI_013840 [Gregarina niphandrodes]|uniref:Uncharacterized protein n=1 Tax=Gregarina niphandrodes TaxID=110365 RepID=A0A023BCE7_GRENI|nr:hypothetical protein GNI_013840 [Gregarina niphandrodes]EZG83901.1 hypothetical protein GNI_013840 [Gregarina niphandrodes]|eukprot:XP_011128900.1 hypothetical protein GNI_013840 [Gregarina niphandrodes]
MGEVDIPQTVARCKRLVRPLAEVYGIDKIKEGYSSCPDEATINISFDRLQTIMHNVDEIANQPLHGSEGAAGGSSSAPRANTAGSRTRYSPFVRSAVSRRFDDGSGDRPGLSGERLSGERLAGERLSGERSSADRTLAERTLDGRTLDARRSNEPLENRRSNEPLVRDVSATDADENLPDASDADRFREARRESVLRRPADKVERLSFRGDQTNSVKRQTTTAEVLAKRKLDLLVDESRLPAYATRGNQRYLSAIDRPSLGTVGNVNLQRLSRK